MEPELRDRLSRSGIDPDVSTAALLLSIRADGGPPRLWASLSLGQTRPAGRVRGIPMAVTLTQAESDARKRPREGRCAKP